MHPRHAVTGFVPIVPRRVGVHPQVITWPACARVSSLHSTNSTITKDLARYECLGPHLDCSLAQVEAKLNGATPTHAPLDSHSAHERTLKLSVLHFVGGRLPPEDQPTIVRTTQTHTFIYIISCQTHYFSRWRVLSACRHTRLRS